MDYDRVKLLIREGEGLTVEFKEKYTSRIDEDIVAFANSKGGAVLLGVADDNTIVCEHLTNELKGRINSLARNCKPGISVNVMQIGDVVVVEVPQGGRKTVFMQFGVFQEAEWKHPEDEPRRDPGDVQ